MSRAANRQLYIVDLVTLLLLVLIVSMGRGEALPLQGTGVKRAFQFRVEVVGLPDEQVLRPAEIGVTFLLDGAAQATSLRNRSATTADVEILDAAGRLVVVQVFAEPAELSRRQADLAVFVRDAGSATNASLDVRMSYRPPPEPGEVVRVADWADVLSASKPAHKGAIRLLEGGSLTATSLLRIDLAEAARGGTAKWVEVSS